MATRVAMINMKGGVGKTTLTVQLAYWFAERLGKRVLVVDLDPQFNATQYLLGEIRTKELFAAGHPTIWHVFENGEPHPGGKVSLDDPFKVLVPIIPPLGSQLTRSLFLLPSQLELAYSLMSPKGKERRLDEFLNVIDDKFDLILIDCAPTLSLLTTAAYVAADHLIVPLKPEYLSSIGLSLLVASLNEFSASKLASSKSPKLSGILFTETDDYSPEETTVKLEVTRLAKAQDWPVFKQTMAYSRSFAKGARQHTPIHKTPHARSKMKDRFSELAREIWRTIAPA